MKEKSIIKGYWVKSQWFPQCRKSAKLAEPKFSGNDYKVASVYDRR